MIASRILHGTLYAVALIVSGPLAAADKPSSNSPLPGVAGDYRIVKPAPKPEPDDVTSAKTGKYGRWDVTISSTITVDITTGKLPLPRN